MKVSVTVITYNQERYIRQTLDSVLMQEVDFEYEIVIGEDCSTDDTRNILLEYKARHPDKIRLLLADRNQGLVRNFIDTYGACKGEYVATLDGDDYWTSPRKLVKQVAFLDRNPELAMCFHPVEMVFEDGSKPSRVFPEIKKETYDLIDLLQSNFIPTCSVMFRNGLFGKFPDWYRSFKFMEDWALYVLIAQHGDIGSMKEMMGVYRFHPRSTWSTLDEITRCREELIFYECMKRHLGIRFGNIIDGMVDKRYYRLASLHEDRHERNIAKTYIARSLLVNPFISPIKLNQKIKTMLRIYFPFLARLRKAHSL